MNTINIPSVEEQIANLRQKSDEEIDFSDIPEITDWSNAVRGKFYQPGMEAVTLRLDKDVLEWFKNNYSSYQTAINHALRNFVTAKQEYKE